jgi:ATP-dependent Lon protease
LPVGGVKDKVLAAHRLGLDTIILPIRNEPELEKLPDEVRYSMKFVFVRTVDEALNVALEPEVYDPTVRRQYFRHTDMSA